jgi:pimeloyl-ACP methyl ester carboxylesterase
MLAGGPGGAATESLAWAASTFTAIHTSRDIVLVDQRGTGGSNAMLFGEPPDLSGLSEAAADAALRDWTAAELARFDADPRFYTTSLAMDDLDLVRDALGYERINLFGASYGATAAQYYIRQHGDRLRTVVLDGGSLLDVPLFELIASNSAAALDGVGERCAADAECAAAIPDLRGDLEDALATLAEGPVTTAVTNPATNEPIVIDAGWFAGALHTGLLNATTSALIPWFIHAAGQGRWDDVAAAALAATGGKLPETDSPVMSAVIRCSEAWAAYDPDDVEQVGEGSYYLAVQLDAARRHEASCRYTPEGIVPADDAEPARTDVPVLLVVGSADPQDPPANIADAPADFPNSLTVIAPGHGHTVAHLGCLPRVVDAFVEAGTAVGLDTSCVDDGDVPLEPFRLP